MSTHPEKRPHPTQRIIRDKLGLDSTAIQSAGCDATTLMGHAGEHLAKSVKAACPSLEKPRITLLCGPGNNGGDGFTCALTLKKEFPDWDITVAEYRPDSQKPRTTEAEYYYQQLTATASITLIAIATDTLDTLKQRLRQSHIIVDALYGVGLNRPIPENSLSADCIRLINLARSHDKAYVISADIPSGLDSQTGQHRESPCVYADETVVFTAWQPGHWLEAGRDACGRKHVVDIGIPASLIESLDTHSEPLYALDTAWAKRLLPKRPQQSHKGHFGNVLIIAGSRTMPGAAHLSATAALHSGAGRVTLAAPESVFQQHHFPSEIMRLPLAETNNGQLSASAMDLLQVNLSRFNAIALGPGLGLSPHTQAVFQSLLRVLLPLGTPLILDADALSLWSQSQEKLGPNVLVTPHVGETARMLGLETNTVSCDLYQAARTLQDKTDAHVILKSSGSVLIPHPSQSTVHYLATAGNAGMATAGAGDVLTGILAGLVAQGLTLPHAMALGVHLHGLAGDYACQHHTSYCVTATTIIENLPEAFKRIITSST